MINRNKGFANLTAGYLFPEVARRRREFAARHPDASIISLGIGNTTEPLTPHIAKAMSDYALALSTPEGYSGYGDEQGMAALREKLAQVFYPNMISPDEVFVSDGAKCDIARVQVLFGKDVKIIFSPTCQSFLPIPSSIFALRTILPELRLLKKN